MNEAADPEAVRRIRQNALIEPITAGAAIIVAWWSVEAGQAALLVIPLAFGLQRWRGKRNAQHSTGG